VTFVHEHTRLEPSLSERHALSSGDTVARKDGLIEARCGEEIVVLSIEQGYCYGFNKIGSHIWDMLALPTQVDDLFTTLRAEYDVDPHVCSREVLDLLEQLRAEGLISVINDR
jgi:hypothetical protein